MGATNVRGGTALALQPAPAARTMASTTAARQLAVADGATSVPRCAYRGRLAGVEALLLPDTVASVGADAFTGGTSSLPPPHRAMG